MSHFPDIAIDDVSVVVKGAFNPAIFSPAWLALQELISPAELESATTEVAVKDLNVFRIGNILFQVTHDTCQVSTESVDDFEHVRDIAVGTLLALSQIPVGALGINRNMHAALPDEQSWHQLGDHLTPKTFWDSFLVVSGMQSLTIHGMRQDDYQGYRQITVQPSSRVKYGVFVAYNDHFVLTTSETRITRREQLDLLASPGLDMTVAKNAVAVRILTEEWERSLTAALDVARRIVGQGRE